MLNAFLLVAFATVNITCPSPQDAALWCSLSREISGGQTHSYSVFLAAGQSLQGTAKQHGIDIAIGVLAPDGKPLLAVDTISALVGVEPFFIVAKTEGLYQLEIRTVDRSAAKGAYDLRVEQPRLAAAGDVAAAEAQQLFADGRRLEAQETGDSLSKSNEKYAQALAHWQSASNRWYQAVTLDALGGRALSDNQPQAATDRYRQALVLWRDLGDVQGEAEALTGLGDVYGQLDFRRPELDYYRQALPLIRAAGDRVAEGAVLNDLGLSYWELGQNEEALGYYSQALALGTLAAAVDRATVYENLGLLDLSRGDNQKAIEELTQALGLFQHIHERRKSAHTLDLIGYVHSQLGDFPAALNFYWQALALSRQAGDARTQTIVLQDVGTVYADSGDFAKAFRYFNQALALSRASQRRNLEAEILGSMGAAYANAGQARKALPYCLQALQLQREGEHLDGQAIELLEEGRLYAALGDTARALEALNEALALNRKIQSKDGEAQTLAARAQIERNTGRFDAALADLQAALPIVESTRSHLESQTLRTSYFASKRNYYDLYADVLMRLHRTSDAFDISEHARARSLLDTLALTHATIRQGADSTLLDRQHRLQDRIDAEDRLQGELLERRDRTEQAATVAKELAELSTQYDEVSAQIRAASPHYAALTQPRTLSWRELKQNALDGDTLLLEYLLGEQHSYLWAATTSTLEGFELPSRTVIQKAVKRAYSVLSTPPAAGQQGVPPAAPPELMELSQIILGPAGKLLGSKRLLIVGDDALQYIPFACLPNPAGSGKPLVTAHEVVYLPSASVLPLLRQEMEARTAADRTVAVLSDPVFERDDPRVHLTTLKRGSGPPPDQGELTRGQLTRSMSESGISRLQRLLYSRREADAIQQLAAPNQVLRAVDFDASRATATSPELGRYRIVHFATHALLNSQHPELSGIVLSLVDVHGAPQNGFLRMHEIYNLRLSADLVVLSACQTALGTEIKGEGLVGITRGFMYAGVPRVIASLWSVQDDATAALMKRFYQGMLRDRQSPAAALRNAQLAMLQQSQWVSPYYWGGFILQGDWR